MKERKKNIVEKIRQFPRTKEYEYSVSTYMSNANMVNKNKAFHQGTLSQNIRILSLQSMWVCVKINK